YLDELHPEVGGEGRDRGGHEQDREGPTPIDRSARCTKGRAGYREVVFPGRCIEHRRVVERRAREDTRRDRQAEGQGEDAGGRVALAAGGGWEGQRRGGVGRGGEGSHPGREAEGSCRERP